MFIYKVFVIVMLITCNSIISSAQYPACKTPIGEDGQCVPVKSCRNIYALLKSGKVEDRVATYIRRSVCQNPATKERSVCCQEGEITDVAAVATVATVAATTNADPVQSTGDPLKHSNINLLDLKRCGPITADRISNGNKTKVFQYPWMAMLRYETSTGIENKCGGSLISARYVLTAAHCIRAPGITLVQVRLGEHDLSSDIDCNIVSGEKECARPVQDIAVESTILHPEYNKPKYSNDIALIRLAKPADMSEDDVQPICLPVTESLRKLVIPRYIITGWGTTEQMQTSNVLLQALVPFVTLDKCQEAMTKERLKITLSDNQMCAGGDNLVDSCRGDSGGPLQFASDLNGSKFVQFGVVSAGVDSCGVKSVPGIYCKVGNYINWILDNMQP